MSGHFDVVVVKIIMGNRVDKLMFDEQGGNGDRMGPPLRWLKEFLRPLLQSICNQGAAGLRPGCRGSASAGDS